MRIWTSWFWPGLVAVASLTALALWFEAGAIEADIKARSLAALRQQHGWAQVALKGRDLTLSGLAPDPENRRQAMAMLNDIPGIRVVKDASALLPEESPYLLTAKKTDSGVTLSGFVPNEAVRTEILTGLSGMLPGIAVTDKMRLARGAPDGLADLAKYGLSVFSRFSTGAVEISDASLQVSGQALNPDDHQAALEALSAPPPNGAELRAIDITPAAVSDGYRWAATVGSADITLSGYVPDSETRGGILAAAKAARPGLNVKDQMRIASGVPKDIDWLAATREGLSALSYLNEGTVSIRGKVLDLTGQATDAAAFRLAQAALAAGFSSGLVLGTADIGAAKASPDN